MKIVVMFLRDEHTRESADFYRPKEENPIIDVGHYVRVHEVECEQAGVEWITACERMWRLCQNGGDFESWKPGARWLPNGQLFGERSMMCGDVVIVGAAAFVAVAVGFVPCRFGIPELIRETERVR